MLILRQITPTALFSLSRFYAKKSVPASLKSATVKMGSKQVHQEIMRHISPTALITINSDIALRIKSADVHEFPNADALIAELHGGPVKNTTASMKVQVSDDEKVVNVELKKLIEESDFHCELSVPIQANLQIDAKSKVSISAMYGGQILVKARKDINTQEVKSEKISLQSEQGSIKCKGLLLGKQSIIETKEGNISLDKLQGETLLCKSTKGSITTNSCYAETSKFETETGNLNLKNVHKRTSVIVHEQGDIDMTGFHGNLFVRTSGGRVNLQLQELADENIILGDNVSEANINISDTIEGDAYVELTGSEPITLHDNLSHLSDCIAEDKNKLQLSRERDNNHKLLVHLQGCSINLGKLSWADSMKLAMDLNKHTN